MDEELRIGNMILNTWGLTGAFLFPDVVDSVPVDPELIGLL
jgi:hypothetical protein